ncbi:pilus assembly protein TadG-related protein [Yoonia sp. BS5-3]|uniref:Pilus assembly protein TadG-related protein n=1 Tax=Yoonia phaeophyticola TaxID=3137369 RepID=A0ABZ2V2P6_9RHOB
MMITRFRSNTDAAPNLRARFLRAFGKDEDGEIIILTLILLIIMLVVGGMGVDFMRFEARRVVLQSVSDRAVLAAAELDQSLDTKEVVVSYFETAGYEDSIVGEPEIVNLAGSRSVQVRSQIDVNTIFLRLIGMDQLDAPALSAAVEGASNVEVSLVLDISGSMANAVAGSTKMELLKAAASDFVDDILSPEYQDEVSISLIAYSQHVAAGQALFDAINTTPDSLYLNTSGRRTTVEEIDSSDPGFDDLDPDLVTTNHSTCIDFEANDYATMTFDVARTYEQVETFEHYSNYSGETFNKPLCPHEDFQAIIPFSQNVAELQAAIGQYQPTSFTSIHIGMRWATALIDPSMRPLLATVSGLDPAFAGVRPLDYTDTNDEENNVKYIVLMTDGQNVRGRRLDDDYGDDFYYRRAANENPWNYWRNNIDDHPSGDTPTLNNVSEYPDTAAQMNIWLQQSCTAAKDAGVIVFTIAMGAGASGEAEMQECATSENYYYATEGGDISYIFEEIAANITELRLSL